MDIDVIKKLRGFFPDNLYIGGSWAIHQSFPSIEYKDVDVFILMPRRFETWALKFILEAVFDYVEIAIGGDEDCCIQEYYIENQWKLARGYIGSMKYDLIFVDEDLDGLLKNTGSTLSKLYYKVDYRAEVISFCNKSTAYLDYMVHHKCIQTNSKKLNNQAFKKVKDRADILGFKMVVT